MNKYQKGNVIHMIIVFIFIIGIVGVLIASPIISYTTMESTTITVKDKERICSGSNVQITCKYLVYTTEGVYENTDDFWQWKFNSSDIYNDLEEGYTYQVVVNGFRVPFLSMYKNILEVN